LVANDAPANSCVRQRQRAPRGVWCRGFRPAAADEQANKRAGLAQSWFDRLTDRPAPETPPPSVALPTRPEQAASDIAGPEHRFDAILRSALERLQVCSNDPVCGDHVPASSADDRALHGAACHGCLSVAETSCESRNWFLDRALLIDTVAEDGAAFFGGIAA
jgi:hypothetical protein